MRKHDAVSLGFGILSTAAVIVDSPMDLFSGECRARFAYTYVQSDLAFRSPLLYHKRLLTKTLPDATKPDDMCLNLQQFTFGRVRINLFSNKLPF